MTEPDGVFPEPARPAPSRRFSVLFTITCSLVVAVYIALPLGPLITPSSPLAQLERPEESLDRLVTRELDLREAMRHGLRWEWPLYRILTGGEDPVREAGTWYEELSETIESASAELHRAILLGESGDADGVEEAIAQWKSWGESGERMAGWVTAAYLAAPSVDESHALIAEVRDQLGSDWFADTLAARIASRVGDAEARSAAEAAIVTRGRALRWRLRALMALVAALLVGGALALTRMWRSSARVAGAPLPPDWGLADGYALFVRSLGAPQAIILTIIVLLRHELPFETALVMAADLPIFWWVTRYLHARETSVGAAFGLVPRRDAWPRLAGVTLILIALALVSDTAIDTVGGLVGLKSHWADGFSEDMLWDRSWAFALDVANVTLWAPIVEELTFRGLLYSTLRTRLGVWPAALLSAALFALPHGYAAAGSLSVLVSGVLWGLAYERTRSLLPGLLAHSANNLISTLWVVGLLG